MQIYETLLRLLKKVHNKIKLLVMLLGWYGALPVCDFVISPVPLSKYLQMVVRPLKHLLELKSVKIWWRVSISKYLFEVLTLG